MPGTVKKQGRQSAHTAAIAADQLPQTNNPGTRFEIALQNVLDKNEKQRQPFIIIDDVVQSNHKCDCGTCEDCQGHFQELLHRRY